VVSVVEPDCGGNLVPGRLNLTKVSRFEFGCLRARRAWVRQRLLSISRNSVNPNWGRGGYIALHIRLGDFAAATRAELEAGDRANLRLPLDWYITVLRRLSMLYPDMPAIVFSDGMEADLAPVLRLG